MRLPARSRVLPPALPHRTDGRRGVVCGFVTQVVFLRSQRGSPAQPAGHDPLQELHTHPRPAGLREFRFTGALVTPSHVMRGLSA